MKKRKKASRFKTPRRRFNLNFRELAYGDEHPELEKVQLLLVRLGYLSKAYQPELLDEATHMALSFYQAFQGLEPTGKINPETVERLTAPRCGNEDLPEIVNMTLADLAREDFAPDLKRGCSYHDATLTYTIEKFPHNGPSFDNARKAIDTAFKTWDNAIKISLKPAVEGEVPAFKLKFAKGDHGDGEKKNFDGRSGLYAHAFYPPDCDEPFPGECHFDDEETWGIFDDSETETMDLETVALHEIGHLLGLTHSKVADSVMAPAYAGERRKLVGDALEAIQSIYGKP